MTRNRPPARSGRTLPARFGRLSAFPRLGAGLIAVLASAGLYLVADGLYMKAKAALAQLLLEQAFARAQAGAHQPRPWSWADTWPVASLEIPRINKRSIVLADVSGEALAFGPGLMPSTSLPGEPGTTVIAAHRDSHFRFLRHVRTGDAIDVTRADGQTFTYRVTGFRVVRWDRPGIDVHTPDDRLILATCWPFDATVSGPLRYLVEARPEVRRAAIGPEPNGQLSNKK